MQNLINKATIFMISFTEWDCNSQNQITPMEYWRKGDGETIFDAIARPKCRKIKFSVL